MDRLMAPCGLAGRLNLFAYLAYVAQFWLTATCLWHPGEKIQDQPHLFASSA